VAKKGMQELVDLSPEELVTAETDLREELFQARFKNQMRQLDNPLRIRHLRRQVARAKTLIANPVQTKAKAKASATAAPKAAAEKPAKEAKAKKAAKAPAKEKAR
jgi:large subunit ribosomal protein L29